MVGIETTQRRSPFNKFDSEKGFFSQAIANFNVLPSPSTSSINPAYSDRLKGLAKGLTLTGGAAISAGIFGGPVTGISTAIGGLAGTVLGGPAGAAAGIGIGTTVGLAGSQIQQGLGGIAETTSEFRALQIALAGVSKDQDDFTRSMSDMRKISMQFLIPQKTAIKQFTRLKASIIGV